MKRHTLPRFFRLLGLAGLCLGLAAGHLAAQCTGEVLNVSAPTHSTSGTTANWTVPSGGPYKVKITAKGAQGGNVGSFVGGSGATMSGDFIVNSGQLLNAIAGAPGAALPGGDTRSGGGGGGSGVQFQDGTALVLAGGGGGAIQRILWFGSGGNAGQVSNSGNQGGTSGNSGSGGGGGFASNGENGNANGGGAGFGGLGGAGTPSGGAGGGGYGGGGSGSSDNGGGGGGGYSGGNGTNTGHGGGGGGSYNLGANQNNTAGANNGGGQVIIECLGAAVLTATATPTQPVCATPTQGSASIDLTGDLNGYTSGGLEYAVVSGGTFSGSPTFADVLADPFSITSGTGTVADLDGETYTVRVRVKYNPTVFVDVTYTLTSPASTRIWTGAVSTDWNTADNWNPACVPAATDDVVIPNVANDPVIGAGTVAVAKSVHVQPGGLLTIAATGSLTINGFFDYGSNTAGLRNEGTVSNSGQLVLGSTSSVGAYGLWNEATFTNNTGGTISIDRSSNSGLFNNTGTFTNAGTLTIGGGASVGAYGIRNRATFTNNTGGTISIDRSLSAGLYNNLGTFTNAATLTIGGTESVGIYGIFNQATFTNNTGGTISIDRSSSTGLYNFSNTFTNAGTLTIGGVSAGDLGIINQATFNNNACGEISMFAPLNNSSNFTNAGLFRVSTLGTHDNSALTNNGIITYPQGNPIPNLTNNDVVVQPVSGSCAISPALSLGGAVSFTAGTNWFLNSNLTGQAGTYNQATNTFTSTNLPGGVPTTVYFSVTDNASGCARTVSINITAGSAEICDGVDNDCNGTIDDVAVNCSTVGTRTWTGAVSTDWHTPCNWNPACVPAATDDVVIPNVANDPVIGTAAVAKSVHVQGGAQLSIGATGNLAVNGFFTWLYGHTIAFLNEGTVSNDGTLNIGNVSSVGETGVANYGTLNNNASGQIFINRSSATGIVTYGTFTNAGYLEVGGSQSVGNYGIFIQNSFTNAAGGQISVDRASERGIDLFSGVTNFNNFGSITIGASGNVGSLAINVVSSTFNNTGCSALIIILSNSVISTAGAGSPVITNSGTIIENANGTSNITSNTGIVQNLNGGTFNIATNMGKLTTATGDIWTGCTSTDWATASNWHDGSVPTASDDVVIPYVTNNPVIGTAALAKSVHVQPSGLLTIAVAGSLTINGFFNYGSNTVGLRNEGTVSNSGQLVLGSTSSVGTYGLWNEATFTNNTGGTISIDRSSSAGLYNNLGTFTNAATLTIGGGASVGIYGILNQATFTNNTGGTISIDRSSSFGLYNNSGTFTNAATLTIGGGASVGIYGIRNQATFTNNTGGTISIDRSSSAGLYNNTGTFTNAATLTIGGGASVGDYGIENQATFTNNTGGTISIDRSSSIGLYNVGTFTNAATLTIGGGASVGIYGIRNQVTFNNNACGEISMFAPLTNSSNFTNAGLFRVSTLGTHDNSALTNNGIITYPQGNPIPNVTNNDVVVQPVSGGCTDVNNALQLGGAVSFTAGTTWYLDESLTQSGGTYNPATNTFTPTNLPAGVPTTVYFSVTDNASGCARTVSINITAGSAEICDGVDNDCNGTIDDVAVNCSTAGTRTWTGAVSTDWHTPCNWNPACVPAATDDVVIPNVANDPVIGTAAVAKSVHVQPGGLLTIAVAGSLTINGFFNYGSNTVGLRNEGTVSNSGQLVLGSTSSVGAYGLWNEATFTNNTGGTISIDRSSSIGLYNLSGTFTNAATLTIGGGASVGDYGIVNQATFNNNTGGTISIDRSSSAGLYNFSNTFTNAGTLTIGGGASVGNYCLWNLATFNNNTGGTISIDRSSDIGLFNLSGTFTNAATLTIGGGASVGDYGIVNQATFNNNACGEISMFAPLINLSNFTNAGLFRVSTLGTHANSALTNNGIITYPQGNPIPNVTNNDVVVQPVSGGCTDVNNALQLGGAVSFTAGTTWYLDESLTQSGGTYNPATNTFTPTNLPVNTPTTLYFSVTDDANACVRTVSVQVTLVDATAPSITCPADATVAADGSCAGTVGVRTAATLSDNCGAPTVVQSPASGTVLSGHDDMGTVVLTADDGHGNTATCSFTVTLKDVTAPTVVCKPATLSLNSGGTAALPTINIVEIFDFGASSDNCSYANVQSISPNVFGCGDIGANTVTLTATDAAGNAGSCTATVTITDATPPGIVCPGPVTVGTSGGQCSGTATWAVPVPTDNCAGAGIQSASHLPGAAFGGGTTTVSYVASDAVGNTASCAFAVTVVDDDPPVAACKAASVTLNASGTAALLAPSVNDGSTDNCTAPGDLSLSVSPNLFGCADVGPNTVTLTVADGTGHSGQCTAVVTVVDALHFTQVAAPVAVDGLAGDRLGHGVGLWGGVLVAGAPDDKVGTQAKQGTAYVFLQDAGGTGNWGQLKQIKASDGAAVDYFGNAVSVDGGLALVGAHGDNVGAATDAGSAYIYEKDHLGTDNWGQRAKFGAVNGGTPEPAAYDYYGNAVSLRGGRAVVGAAKKQVGPNAAQGAVYVHEKDAGGANAWGHVKKLVASDGGANNFFGQSVSQWGDVVLVGASGNLSNRGAAYLFGKDTGGAGNWGQGQKLTASDAAVGDGFGTSVSLTSGHAIIGAPNKGVYAGAAYIFKNDGGSWSQAKKLVASDGAPGDRFGTSVWLSGEHAYVSAVQAGGTGAVYVFHRDAGGACNWGEVGKYQPVGGSPGERFGHVLAASGDRVALGAPLSDVSGRVDQGRAYVLDGEDCGGLPRLQAGEQQTATATKRAPARGLALSAYPNPFADELRVELAIEAQAVAGTRVVLADATGRPVAEAEFAAGQAFAVLRTAALQPGMYFVQARTKAGLQVVPVALVR